MTRDMGRAAALAGVAAALLVTSCGAGAPRDGGRSAAPGPGPTPGRLVATTWVADPSASAGPYPGFRPQLTDITQDMIRGAEAAPDPNGGAFWDVTLTFDSAGSAVLSRLSTQAVHACSNGTTGTCPGSHITWWLDLTRADVDRWSTEAASLYQSADRGGKLLTDPYVQEPMTNGTVVIGGFSQRQATALAARING